MRIVNYKDTYPDVYPLGTHAPLYEHVEFCKRPEALWAKIESHWDWLGVKPDGTFVVGHPRRPAKPERARPQGPIHFPGTNGDHTVRYRPPIVKEWQDHWQRSESEAKAKFRKIVEYQSAGGANGKPVLLRVQRLEMGQVVEEQLVVTRFTTYR